MLEYTHEYFLFIENEFEIDEKDYILAGNEVFKVKGFSEDQEGNDVILIYPFGYVYSNEIKKIRYYFPLRNDSEKLDLPLLPNPFNEDEKVDNSYAEFCRDNPTEKVIYNHFKAGYEAFQAKKFSLEDMWKAAIFGFDSCNNNWDPVEMSSEININQFNNFIKGVRVLPTEFIAEEIILNSNGEKEIKGIYKN